MRLYTYRFDGETLSPVAGECVGRRGVTRGPGISTSRRGTSSALIIIDLTLTKGETVRIVPNGDQAAAWDFTHYDDGLKAVRRVEVLQPHTQLEVSVHPRNAGHRFRFDGNRVRRGLTTWPEHWDA